MTDALNQQYRNAAQEFACRVISEMGHEVDSIVLYGSVARGEATEDSDVDIMVISYDERVTRDRVNNIRNRLTNELDYAFIIPLVQIGREEFYRLRELGAPFIAEVLRDGVELYDNGVFSRICVQAIASR